MRIIAGQWRGRNLTLPPQDVTRPTTDRVREALFSMLHSRMGGFEDKYVLDAFAGSGAFGLEALSRGAAHVIFAEKNAKTMAVLQRNIKQFNCHDKITLVKDAFNLPVAEKAADLVFLDPPYDVGLEELIVPFLIGKGYVGKMSILILETKSTSIPIKLGMLKQIDSRVYGACAISLWKI